MDKDQKTILELLATLQAIADASHMLDRDHYGRPLYAHDHGQQLKALLEKHDAPPCRDLYDQIAFVARAAIRKALRPTDAT